MKSYAEQLDALQLAIIAPEAHSFTPQVKETRAAFTAEQRVAVYAEGYTQRLAEAVRADYPALTHYMGLKKFQDTVGVFIANTPSTGWDLNQYPARFADFMKRYYADEAVISLAILEGAISEIFWQPEQHSLDVAALASLSETELGKSRFHFSSTTRLLKLTHDANHYLSAFRVGQEATMPAQSCYLMMTRFQQEVHRRVIDPLEYTLLLHLKQGANLDEALTRTGESEELTQKLSGYIAHWLHYGVFSSIY